MVPNSAGGSSRSCIPRVPAARRRGGSPWGQSCESAECNPLRDDRRSSRQVAAYRFGRERESRFLKFDNRCFSTMSRVEYSPFARPTLLPHCLERLVVAVRHWLVAKEQERVEASQRRADTGFTTIQKIRLCVFWPPLDRARLRIFLKNLLQCGVGRSAKSGKGKSMSVTTRSRQSLHRFERLDAMRRPARKRKTSSTPLGKAH